ncbi:MAG: hypothetical protein WC003_03095 [Terrimicrobiaceae bacterium]
MGSFPGAACGFVSPTSRTGGVLATIARNTIVPAIPSAPGWDQDTEPTPLQKKILDLLDSLPIQ